MLFHGWDLLKDFWKTDFGMESNQDFRSVILGGHSSVWISDAYLKISHRCDIACYYILSYVVLKHFSPWSLTLIWCVLQTNCRKCNRLPNSSSIFVFDFARSPLVIFMIIFCVFDPLQLHFGPVFWPLGCFGVMSLLQNDT